MVALASAFVRLRPEISKPEFRKSGEDAGTEAGVGAGKGFEQGYKRDANGRLRDVHGKYVTDSTVAGGKAGEGFTSGFSKGTGKLKGLIGDNLKLAAGVFVPLGLAGAVGEIGKIGIAYENNLNIFRVVSKATGAQMAAVAEQARKLGADVNLPGVSAAGAAEAMTELAKAGFTVQQSMDAARGTLQLARIANISEADAAEIAANAVNAFGLAAKDTGFVVDELAASANSSSVEISDVSLAFKQAAAVFSGIQGPATGSKEAITELNTAIAILGNNGIKGSDAGTSLKQTLLQLTGPSDKAKGAMRAVALAAAGANGGLKELLIPVKSGNKIEQIHTGLTLMQAALTGTKKQSDEAINQLDALNPKLKNVGDIAYDSAGRMRPLRDIIGLLTAGLKDETQENKNAAITTIFGADAARSIIALMKGGLPVYDAQRKAVLEGGAAAKVAAAQNAGLGGALDNVKSQFENAAIAIYNVAKGPLTRFLTSIANQLPGFFAQIGHVFGFIRDNFGVFRDWALAIGAVTLALRINSAMLAITAAGGVIKYIQGIRIVSGVTRGWAAAQVFLNATLLANPVGAVIVGLTALAAGLILAYRHSETFRKIVQGAWTGIKVAVSATISFFTGTVWPALIAVYDGLKGAALGLWHNAIEPAWHGIMAVVGVVVSVVRGYIGLLVAEFNVIKTVALFLWHNVFSPVFAGISKAVQIAWLAIQIIFVGLYKIIAFTLTPVINGFKVAWGVALSAISAYLSFWWGIVRGIFSGLRTYIVGPITASLVYLRTFFTGVFSVIGAYVSAWYNAKIRPTFLAVRAVWDVLATGLSAIWTGKIRPVFAAVAGFVTKDLPNAFRTGVAAIKKAWEAVQAAARVPVAFVVNHIINPFIGGLNAAAKVVGVKDRVSPIAGFAKGGEIPGYAMGGKISGAGSTSDNRLAPAAIPGVGAVKLMGGEFVVNRQDTARALPLLKWVNAGMKGGLSKVASYLGRPLTDYPGDGSEGWAFKDGGLVGWVKDVWNAVSHPLDTIKKPFESLLGQIPGSGMIKDFLIGSGKRLLNGAVGWLTKGSGGGGDVGKARSFVQAQAGKPYVWASAGPGGYDCSGIVSAAYNVLKGKNPYSHTFSTESLPGPWFRTGARSGALVAGWSHPGQSPASASVGHMAGTIGGLPFESRGSRGVVVGGNARGVGQFANIGAARAAGGLLGKPVRLFDNGGPWPSGTLGANLSGRTEYVDPNRGGRGGDVHIHLHNDGVIGSQAEVDRWFEKAYKRAVKDRKI
jgi:TP901 family phage tail tape measure protein